MLTLKNYMSIFGKCISQSQLKINLQLVNLDPLNPDSIIMSQPSGPVDDLAQSS